MLPGLALEGDFGGISLGTVGGGGGWFEQIAVSLGEGISFLARAATLFVRFF